MKPDQPTEELSELELAIINRERKTFEFDILDILGNTKKPLGKVKMRVATLFEQEEAIKGAQEYAEKNCSNLDPDSYVNIKHCFILHKVCLRIGSNVPAFYGPVWMIKNLGTQEIARLLNNYHEVLRIVNPSVFDFSNDKLKAFAEICAAYNDSDAPNIFLQDFSRSEVAEVAIRLGILYHESVTTSEKE